MKSRQVGCGILPHRSGFDLSKAGLPVTNFRPFASESTCGAGRMTSSTRQRDPSQPGTVAWPRQAAPILDRELRPVAAAAKPSSVRTQNPAAAIGQRQELVRTHILVGEERVTAPYDEQSGVSPGFAQGQPGC